MLDEVTFALKYAYLVFAFLLHVIIPLYVFVLIKVPIFHHNLRILLINLPVTYGMTSLPKLVLILHEIEPFFDEKNFQETLTTFTNIGMYSCALNLVSFVVERCFAMVLFVSYETSCSNFPLLGILLIGWQWTLGAAVILLYNNYVIPVAVIYAIVINCYFISLASFSILHWLNNRHYERERKRQIAENRHSLSERYQLSENVRSARLLNPLIVLISVTSFIGVAAFTYASFYAPPKSDAYRLGKAAFELVAPAQGVFALLLALHRHHSLRDALYTMCRRRREGTIKRRKSFIPRTLQGQKLVLSIDEQRKAYFEAYQRQWN